jgi:hypothetical protein
VVSYNLLSHGYTKFNQALHGQSTPVESHDQMAARRRREQDLVAALNPAVLLLQEHDHDFAVAGYRRGVRAFVDGRTEGCSVLLADAVAAEMDTSFTVDLGDGKSAAVGLVGGVWFISCHLKGGPGSEGAKKRQVGTILRALRVAAGDTFYAVWAGDMNETAPGELFGEECAGAGFTLLDPVGPTGLTSRMDTALALDHVLLHGLPRGAVTVELPLVPDTKTPWAPDATQGSDHVPVVIRVSSDIVARLTL